MQPFVRWLLLLILALDLASSPLHAHAHDMGVDRADAAAIASLAKDGHVGLQSDRHAFVGHSVLALRADRSLDTHSTELALLPGSFWVPAEPTVTAEHEHSAYSPPALRPPPRRSWPSGRAPPSSIY